MHTLSYTNLRTRLAEVMTEVADNHAPVIIKRGNTEPVVMISLSDFESYEETSYLLKSPINRQRLKDSVDEIDALIQKRLQHA